MTAHPAIAAVPKAGTPNQALIQSLLVSKFIYWLAPDATPGDFDPRSDGLGDYVPVIYFQGSFFERDGTDETTPASSVCLVTADSSRYKIISYDLLMGYSILANDVVDPPDPEDVDEADRPNLGDAYRVPAGGSGDWATKEDSIAIWTSRGWAYVEPKIGRLVFNQDTGGYEHINAAGNWELGVGNNPIAAGVLLPSMLSAGGARLHWIAENATTNTPPTVIDHIAYVIGPSPTGVWTGHAGKIAHGENGSWVIYTPAEGWKYYNKATDTDYLHSGSAWISASGDLIATTYLYTSSDTFSKNARCVYVEVEVVGGGGDPGQASSPATSGSTSSFGSHCSATGGAGGRNIAGGAGGIGSGGDINLTGQTGQYKGTTTDATPLRGGIGAASLQPKGAGGDRAATVDIYGAGGGGGGSHKRILAASLGSSETVTVGSAAQNNGYVLVKEYTRA